MNLLLNQFRDIILLRAMGDALTATAYLAIPAAIFAFLYRQNRNVPFNRVTVSCGLFVFCCGLTRTMDVVVLWHPWYVLKSWVGLLGGIGSWIALTQIIPALPSVLGASERELNNLALVRELAALKAERTQDRHRDILKAFRLRALARDLGRYAEQMDVEIPAEPAMDETEP